MRKNGLVVNRPAFADRKKYFRYGCTALMVMLMTGVAQWTGEKEIIFPEMAALAIGMWIIDKRVWQTSRLLTVVLMSAGAVWGVCIVRYFCLPLVLGLATAFAFAALLLVLSRTSLTPLLSACMLPVLLGTRSWVYPVAVFTMTLIVVLIQKAMEKWGLRRTVTFTPIEKHWKNDLGRWLVLLAVVISFAALCVYTSTLYCILPPLVVTFVEFANSKAGFRNRPVQVFGLLVGAAIIGTTFQWASLNLGLPQTAAVLLICISLFALFEWVGHLFAPAGAVAIIPLLIPPEGLYWLPLQIAGGAAVFILAAMLLFQRCYRWPRPHLIVCWIPGFLRRRRKR